MRRGENDNQSLEIEKTWFIMFEDVQCKIQIILTAESTSRLYFSAAQNSDKNEPDAMLFRNDMWKKVENFIRATYQFKFI